MEAHVDGRAVADAGADAKLVVRSGAVSASPSSSIHLPNSGVGEVEGLVLLGARDGNTV